MLGSLWLLLEQKGTNSKKEPHPETIGQKVCSGWVDLTPASISCGTKGRGFTSLFVFFKQGWEPWRSFCPLQKMIIALLAGGGKQVVWLVETGEWHCPKRTNHMSKPVNIFKAAFNFPQLLQAVEKAFKHADFTLQVFKMPSTHQSARTHPLPPRRCRVLAS